MLLLQTVTIIFVTVFLTNAENSNPSISSIFAALGYSPGCVSSILNSCNFSSKKELSIDTVDSFELILFLLLEKKVARENDNKKSDNLRDYLKNMSHSLSNVETILQEIKATSNSKNLAPVVNSININSLDKSESLLLEMKSERENMSNYLTDLKLFQQTMKSDQVNIANYFNEVKSERENEKKNLVALWDKLENISGTLINLETILQDVTVDVSILKNYVSTSDNFTMVASSVEIQTAYSKDGYSEEGKQEQTFWKNCAEIKLNGNSTSEVRTIYPIINCNQTEVEAYCDQVTDGGGWTVIQNRDALPVRETFERSWNEYAEGFGNSSGEYWLGLENIHALTSSAQMELRIHLEDWEGEKRWANYGIFYVGDAASKYVLTIGNFSGDAGDSMTSNSNIHNLNGMKFSTHDQDNDKDSRNCAVEFRGAWWFNGCSQAKLNGYQYTGKHSSFADGIDWNTFRDAYYSLKKASMKIRPVPRGF